MSDVVVVESPAKAKTINRYLGGGYTVLASFGHVRDLPPKDGSVRPDQDFAMDWESDARGEKQVGIKMGFTSRDKMVQMGVHDMIWGRLTDAMIRHSCTGRPVSIPSTARV